MALCGAGARDGRRHDGNASGKAAAAYWDRSDALRWLRLLCGGERLGSLDDDERDFRRVCPMRNSLPAMFGPAAQPALLNGLWWLIGRSVMLPSFPPLSFRVLMRSNSLRFWLHIAYFL